MIYSGFKVIEAEIFFMENSDYFSEILYGRHTDLVHKFDTYVSHSWSVCSPTVTYNWFPVILCKSWRVPHVCGAGNAHSFRNTWFHYFWGVHDFTNSYIHLYVLLNLSVLGLCLRIDDSGLFAWISLTALSRTYLFHLAKWVVFISRNHWL